jgi:hypothetical protein
MKSEARSEAVDFAEISKVLLGRQMPNYAFDAGNATPAPTTSVVRRLADVPRIVLIDADMRVAFCGGSLALPNMQYALYRTVALAASEQWPGVGPNGVGTGHKGWLAFTDFFDTRTRTAREFLAAYDDSYVCGISRPHRLRELMEKAANPALSAGLRDDCRQEIRAKLSPCRSAIKKAFASLISDTAILSRIKIYQASRRSNGARVSTFGFLLSPPQIAFETVTP